MRPRTAPPKRAWIAPSSALYEPGSRFKIVTLSAAIDQGVTSPDEVVDCQNGAIYIAGHRIRDHKAYGLLTVSQILAKSSDVGAIKIGLRLGAPKFYDYIRAFGFGQPTGVDLPGESRGMLRRLENWTPVSVGSISMGQEVGVTPLQMITAVSAIANGGLIVRPHVVRELRRGEQTLPAEAPLTPAEPRRVIRRDHGGDHAPHARRRGAERHGQAGPAGWLHGGGKNRHGAENRSGDRPLFAHAVDRSFVGFAPINTPAVTILVQLDSPVGAHEGGQVAAPVFKRVAQQVLAYLDVPRDVPLARDLRLASRVRAATRRRDRAMLSDFDPAQIHPASRTNLRGTAPAAPRCRRSRRSALLTVELAEGEGIPVPQLRGEDGARGHRDVPEAGADSGLGRHAALPRNNAGAGSDDAPRGADHRQFRATPHCYQRSGAAESKVS